MWEAGDFSKDTPELCNPKAIHATRSMAQQQITSSDNLVDKLDDNSSLDPCGDP